MVPRKSYSSELVIESQNLEVLFLVLTFHLGVLNVGLKPSLHF